MRGALLSGIGAYVAGNPSSDFVRGIGGEKFRYWPMEAEQRAQYPYAVSFIVSDVDVGAIHTPISEFEWQMMIFSKTLKQGNELAAACKRLFADASIEYEPGCWFSNIYLSTYSPMRSSDDEPFQTTVTFSCSL